MKQFFSTQSRIAMVVLGALVFAAVGITLAVLVQSLVGNDRHPQVLANHATGATASAAPSPTAIVGTPVDLRGTILSIAADGGSFVLSLADGPSQTVVITAQTQFGGDDGVTQARLQVGMLVRVRGNRQADGSVSALLVRAEERG